MRFTQVSYQKTFNLGSYQSERIGVELELSEGESPKEALDTAKQLVEEYHKENNKGLTVTFHPENIPSSAFSSNDTPMYFVPTDKKQPLPEDFVSDLSKLKPIPPPKQTIEEQIASCTDIKILESYKLIVKKNPELQKVYDLTMDKLTQKTK